MSNERNNIVEKIRKLSELANADRGGFEGEIANASALMQALMEKYSVSIDEVYEAGNKKQAEENFISMNSESMLGKLRQWHWSLARIVAKITHTKHFSRGQYSKEARRTTKGKKLSYGSTIAFYGKETNVRIATSLFDEWILKLTFIATQATDVYKAELLEDINAELEDNEKITDLYRYKGLDKDDHPNTFRLCWLNGCLMAIANALYEQEKSREESIQNAIVIYDEKLAIGYKDFSSDFKTVSNKSSGNFNGTGFHRGSETGKNIRIGLKTIETSDE